MKRRMIRGIVLTTEARHYLAYMVRLWQIGIAILIVGPKER